MKKSYQSSMVGLNLSNQIVSITITGDFMILFMSQILNFSDLQNSWLITMLPIIALVRIPLSYLMRRKNLLDLMRWSILSKLCLLGILVVIPYESVTFSSSISDSRGVGLWSGLESLNIIINRRESPRKISQLLRFVSAGHELLYPSYFLFHRKRTNCTSLSLVTGDCSC